MLRVTLCVTAQRSRHFHMRGSPLLQRPMWTPHCYGDGGPRGHSLLLLYWYYHLWLPFHCLCLQILIAVILMILRGCRTRRYQAVKDKVFLLFGYHYIYKSQQLIYRLIVCLPVLLCSVRLPCFLSYKIHVQKKNALTNFDHKKSKSWDMALASYKAPMPQKRWRSLSYCP